MIYMKRQTMMNSVETALRKGEEKSKFIDGIATVLLTLRSNVAKDKIVIVVEGPDDVQLYRRMYDSDKVIVYAANNCRHIFEILNNLNAKGYSNHLIGIKDADFDHVNGKNYNEYNNLFLTDWHDAEIAELESRTVVETVWNKYTASNASVNLKESIYNELLELSMLKWYNNNFHLNILFKRNKIGASVSCNDGVFDYTLYKASVFARSDNAEKNFPETAYRLWYLNHITDITSDVLPQITNGHDAVELMYSKIKAYKPQNLVYRDFTQSIRDCYPISEYHQTKLATAIDKWARENLGTPLY